MWRKYQVHNNQKENSIMNRFEDFISSGTMTIIVLILGVTIILGSLFGGLMVNKEVAIKAAQIQGFTNIKVLDKAWFFIPLRGGDRGDSARFLVEATNPAGATVQFYVFSGWLFKGATIRTW